MKTITISIFTLLVLIACNNHKSDSDAFGNFEATETIISSQANGQLIKFDVDEGDVLSSGQLIGIVDTIQLNLKLQQLLAQKNVVESKNANVLSQINVLRSQRDNILREKIRFEKLFQDKAATQKQVDDLKGQLDVAENQIKNAETNFAPLLAEIQTINVQMAQTEDQISKCNIIAPISGTVVSKYAEQGEITAFAKPLFKMADLNKMLLRAYMDASSYSKVKTGSTVTVRIDDEKGGLKNLQGKVTWVSSEAEFTPKLIQTKNERANLVYAFKVEVTNDGTIKSGMPGEVKF